ncbi:MAG: hypothetical protein HQ472_08430 [Ignavibacteria bacterium]|nr:hypothetical protein [Ignavibacteria bacterium]
MASVVSTDSVTAFAIKKDTVVIATFLPQSGLANVEVFVAGEFVKRSIVFTDIINRFETVEDGTLFGLTVRGKIYVQYDSLSNGVLDITKSYNLLSTYSASIGFHESKRVLVVVGTNSKDFKKRSIVRIGPGSYDTDTVYFANSDESKIVASTMSSGGILVASESGRIAFSINDVVRYSKPLIPDSLVQTSFNVSAGSESIYVTRHLSYAEPVPVNSKVVSDVAVNSASYFDLPFAKYPSTFKDSIGIPLRLITLGAEGNIMVGSKGIVRADLLAGPWTFSSYPLGISERYFVPTECVLKDGGLMLPYNLNGFMISNDQGKSWSAHVVPKMFQSPRSMGSSSSCIYFTSGWELLVVRKPIVGDTVFPIYRVTATQLKVLELNEDTATYLTATKVPPTSEDFNTIVVYRVDSSGLIDSTFVRLSTALPVGFSLTVFKSGDSISIFENSHARYLLIVGNQLKYESYLTTHPRFEWFTSSFTVRFKNCTNLQLLVPKEGVLVNYRPLDTNTISSVIDDYWHVYVQNPRPNPASGTIVVDVGRFVTADLSNITLEMWSVAGEKVRDFTKDVPKFSQGSGSVPVSLDVSGIARGFYLIAIRNSQTTNACKVIIN